MGTDLRYLKRLLTADGAGLLLEKFEEHRSKFEARLRKAKRKPSENAVHDLRVAARRLLSLLTLLEAVLPSLEVKSLRRKVKKRLRALREMRDLQVQILQSKKLLSVFPQLTPFHKSLLRQERRTTKRVAKDLRKFKRRRFQQSTEKLLDALIRSLDPDNDSALREEMGAAVEVAFRRVLSLRARIDPKEPESIHRARIAFKNFRYIAEIAEPVFQQFDEERLRTLSSYQDRMGVIQDAESLLSAIRDFRRRSGRTSMLVVENEIRRRRQRLIHEFMETVDEVRFFWSSPQKNSREVV